MLRPFHHDQNFHCVSLPLGKSGAATPPHLHVIENKILKNQSKLLLCFSTKLCRPLHVVFVIKKNPNAAQKKSASATLVSSGCQQSLHHAEDQNLEYIWSWLVCAFLPCSLIPVVQGTTNNHVCYICAQNSILLCRVHALALIFQYPNSEHHLPR